MIRTVNARHMSTRPMSSRSLPGRSVITQTAKAVACCLAALLGGCAFPISPQSHTDQATVAACREYASRVYDQNNRGDIYSINQSGVPYSGSYLPDYKTHELAQRYSNARVVDDCIRNTGTETSREDAAAPSSAQP
jgi:hypothetical protein